MHPTFSALSVTAPYNPHFGGIRRPFSTASDVVRKAVLLLAVNLAQKTVELVQLFSDLYHGRRRECPYLQMEDRVGRYLATLKASATADLAAAASPSTLAQTCSSSPVRSRTVT